MGDSATPAGLLATRTINVVGPEKTRKLSDAVGAPMAFFSLSVNCSAPRAKPTINNYCRELLVIALECGEAVSLREKQQDLASATNTESLTAAWTPNQTARGVTGRQPLSCAAFLDFTS